MSKNVNLLNIKYFDLAKNVFDICGELDVSIEDTRLYSYICIRADIYGLDSFSKHDEDVINVLNNLIKNSHDENSVSCKELKDRLKLHSDEKFRKEKMSFYINNIIPELNKK